MLLNDVAAFCVQNFSNFVKKNNLKVGVEQRKRVGVISGTNILTNVDVVNISALSVLTIHKLIT